MIGQDEGQDGQAVTVRMAGGIFALAVLAYVAVIVWFSPLSLQDYPNHLARGRVLADLLFHHGAQFGGEFSFHFLFTSYLGGDLPLASLVALLGVNGAGIVWAVLNFLSLPAAAWFYLRVIRARTEVILLMLFISLYLSTDSFFLMGFLEFKLSIALALVAFAMIELLRERWSNTYFAVFVVLIVLTYLVHLAAVVFIGALQGVSALWRISQGRSRPAREAMFAIPVVCVLLWHFVGAQTYSQQDDLLVAPSKWGTVLGKWRDLSWDFRRYTRKQDSAVTGMLVIFLAFCMFDRLVERGREWLKAPVAEPLSYALLFFGLYVALPFSQHEATRIDERALALAPFFLFQGLLSMPLMRAPSAAGPSVRPEALTIWLAAIFVCVNLVQLTLHFDKDGAWLAQYRAVIAKIPPHATVLPVYTEEIAGVPLKRLHIASFAVIDREALIPYLFTGDRGSPMKYFRYLHRPNAPDELWYPHGLDSTVDWTEIQREYPYLLVMKPFAAERIPIKTRTLAENDAAVLLATR